MIKKIKKLLSAAMIVPALALSLSVFAQAPTYAANQLSIGGGATAAQGDDQKGSASCLFDTGNGCDGGGIFKQITNVLLFLIGAISVIMLIIGGIRYTVSNGDSSAVQSAKNTIMYAIIGVIVAILAYAVVNFVVGNLANNNG